MSPPARNPTMADVAALARVSHQTVSRVLNDMPGVRPGTALRVREAISQLGYRRNQSARTLAARRSGLLGVAIWGTSQHGPHQVNLALDVAAREAGFRLMTRTVHDITEAEIGAAIEELLGQGVEAVVLIIPHEAVTPIVLNIAAGVPIVVVGGDRRVQVTAAVDNVLGARLATRHLLELGHPAVVHVAGPAGWLEATDRIEGWRAELAAWGCSVPPVRWRGDWSVSSGYDAGLSLARERDLTAVFVANDQMAVGVLAALLDAGRPVPGDVSVVGFDDLPESAFLRPTLTSVRQDFAGLGRRAMVLVTHLLTGGTHAAAEDLVGAMLVVRDSSAAPRGGAGRPPGSRPGRLGTVTGTRG